MGQITPLMKILKIMKESSQLVHISVTTRRLERAPRGGQAPAAECGPGGKRERDGSGTGVAFEDDGLGVIRQFIPSFLSRGLKFVPLF